MINIEQDSHGRTYQIWKQEQPTSCGVASIWMARGIARRASFAEEEWGLAMRVYSGVVASALNQAASPSSGPMSINPAAHANAGVQSSMGRTFSNDGISARQVAAALQNEGLRAERHAVSGNSAHINPHKISISAPAIVFVKWDGPGAHFVVAGRCTAREVSFLDPWDGRVNQQPNNGEYTVRYGGHGRICDIIYLSA
jgi:hypothetical protein